MGASRSLIIWAARDGQGPGTYWASRTIRAARRIALGVVPLHRHRRSRRQTRARAGQPSGAANRQTDRSHRHARDQARSRQPERTTRRPLTPPPHRRADSGAGNPPGVGQRHQRRRCIRAAATEAALQRDPFVQADEHIPDCPFAPQRAPQGVGGTPHDIRPIERHYPPSRTQSQRGRRAARTRSCRGAPAPETPCGARETRRGVCPTRADRD